MCVVLWKLYIYGEYANNILASLQHGKLCQIREKTKQNKASGVE